jgi:hypothetical protein
MLSGEEANIYCDSLWNATCSGRDLAELLLI